MPFASVRLVPGVNVERTPSLNQAGYSDSNLGRFQDSLFQKVGGWEKFYPFNVGGVPRDLHAWEDLNVDRYLSVATTTSLSAILEGTLQDITPQTVTSNVALDLSTSSGTPTVTIVDANIANVTTLDSIFFDTPAAVGGLILRGLYPITNVTGVTSYTIDAGANAASTVSNGGTVPSFATTSGSAEVIVTLAAHGLTDDDVFTFPISTTVGGVTISGTYRVIDAPTANTFVIGVNIQATSTTSASMNSGQLRLTYHIALGPTEPGSGYGLGGYGLGGYGTGIVPTVQPGTAITATDWTQDNWGEILLACPTGGPVYQWAPNSGFANASIIETAPLFNTGIFVSMPQQILVTFGSTAGAPESTALTSSPEQQDPLMVRWSDILNYANFTATSTTQAGSFRIPNGSTIVGGCQGPQQGLIWTDIDLWAMNYIGPTLVFSFNKIGAGAGLAGLHAFTPMRGSIYWMGQSNFYVLAGSGVQVIPCPVWDAVFQDLDTDNISKVRAAANTPFNEVWFFYPSLSGGTGENDKYVKYNIVERSWDKGSIGRSAWIDQSVLGMPIATIPQGTIYQHETGNDADGQPINAAMETGYFMISEGSEMSFVDWLLPDFRWGLYQGDQNATLSITLYAIDYPGDTPRTYGPFVVTSATQYVNPRLRGRQMSMRIESSDLGSFWRIGNVRFRYARDGRI